MKKILYLISIFFVFSLTTFGAIIPENTLEVAYEATPQKSEIVRVGIGNGNQFDYDNTAIYGTQEVTVFNNDIEIGKTTADIPVTLENGKFTVQIDYYKKTGLTGPVKFVCEKGFLGVKNLKKAGKDAIYRGEIEIVKYDKKPNRFHIVNVLEVEDYLKGVVPNEMPVSFGLEALKAQAVAARNYVLSPRTKAYTAFDVVDSVASQVYFGLNTERELGVKAVEETEGIVALYNWDLILAQYCSTAGGYTESFSNVFSDPNTKQFPSVSKPYLIATPDMLSQQPLDNEDDAFRFYTTKPDSYDMKSPYFRWERTWTKEELQQEVQNHLAAQSAAGFVHPAFSKDQILPPIKQINILKRGESGKIIELEIVTENQRYKIDKELVIRRLFTNNGKALPSANFVFKENYNDDGECIGLTAYGGGYGHGVGMSQYGAGFMSTELKMPFDKILKHYYHGITLATKPQILSGNNPVIVQNFYTKNKYAQIILDNKYKLSHISVNINGKEEEFDFTNSLFNRIERIDISKHIKHGKNTVTFYYPQDENQAHGAKLFIELAAKDE